MSTYNVFYLELVLYDAEYDEIFIRYLPIDKLSFSWHETEGINKISGSFKVFNTAKNTHLLGSLL